MTVNATTGAPNTPLLVPGASGDVTLRIDNPKPFNLTLTSVTGSSSPSSVTGPGCTITNSGVTFTSPGVLSTNLPANTTTQVHLTGAAAMSTSSANACQGQTFTFSVTVTVQK